MATAQPLSRHRSGPRRDETARAAVLRAADDLLVQVGYSALTVEGIARSAGVAKQTIYRWWPSKADILLDTLSDGVAKHIRVPATQRPSAAQLRAHLRGVARFVLQSDDGAVLVAMVAQAGHDQDTAHKLEDRVLHPWRVAEADLLRRFEESTDVALHAPAPDVFDAFLGALVFRALTGRPSDGAFVRGLLRRTVPEPEDRRPR